MNLHVTSLSYTLQAICKILLQLKIIGLQLLCSLIVVVLATLKLLCNVTEITLRLRIEKDLFKELCGTLRNFITGMMERNSYDLHDLSNVLRSSHNVKIKIIAVFVADWFKFISQSCLSSVVLLTFCVICYVDYEPETAPVDVSNQKLPNQASLATAGWFKRSQLIKAILKQSSSSLLCSFRAHVKYLHILLL